MGNRITMQRARQSGKKRRQIIDDFIDFLAKCGNVEAYKQQYSFNWVFSSGTEVHDLGSSNQPWSDLCVTGGSLSLPSKGPKDDE